jgi:predicted lipase
MPVAIEDLTFDTPQISDLVFEDTPSIDQLHFDNETTNVSQSIPQELTDKQEIDRLTERYSVAKSLTVDPVKLQRLDDEFKRKVAPLMDSRPRTPGALATSQNVNIDELMGKYTQEMPIVVPQDVTTDEPIISEDAALKALKFLRRGSPINNEYTRGAERSVAKMASGLTTSQGVMATAHCSVRAPTYRVVFRR